jgi:hypothetical protein
MTLTEHQKEMVSDLLGRTRTAKDITENAEKIMGNAYGNEKTVKVYKELANLRVARIVRGNT